MNWYKHQSDWKIVIFLALFACCLFDCKQSDKAYDSEEGVFLFCFVFLSKGKWSRLFLLTASAICKDSKAIRRVIVNSKVEAMIALNM